MKKLLFIIALFVLVSISAMAQTKKTIAVPVFEGGSGQDGEVLSDLVSTRFADENLFEVVSRTGIEAIMTEQNFQRSKLTDVSKAQALGKILNADYIVSGRIATMSGVTIITIQVIDVKKGNVIKGESTSLKDFSELIASVDTMVTEIIKSIFTLNLDAATAVYVGKKDVAEIKSLLAGGAINAKDSNGYTALYLASQNGYIEIVKALILTGVYLNIQDNYGVTALIVASVYGHTETVKALITAGTDVNAKDGDGYTALIWASYSGHTEIVKALIAAGADLNVKDHGGTTALIGASLNGYTEIVDMLKAAGARE